LKGIRLGIHISLTHPLFIDDVILFVDGSLRDANIIHGSLVLYCKANMTEVNDKKTSIMFHRVVEQ
jgi:hypothetical protein